MENNMKKMLRFVGWCFFVLCLSTVVHAEKVDAEDPNGLLHSITAEVLAELKAGGEAMKNNPNKRYALMERVMLPYVDLEGMSRWVVGRQIWTEASAEQKKGFTEQFRHLIINTYSGALSEYRNQSIDYLPIRGGFEGKDRVQVESVIRESGRESIHVLYRLVKKPEGWRVYDIVIEGVSLLKGFQEQFAGDLQKKGLDQVTRDLSSHNQGLDRLVPPNHGE